MEQPLKSAKEYLREQLQLLSEVSKNERLTIDEKQAIAKTICSLAVQFQAVFCDVRQTSQFEPESLLHKNLVETETDSQQPDDQTITVEKQYIGQKKEVQTWRP